MAVTEPSVTGADGRRRASVEQEIERCVGAGTGKPRYDSVVVVGGAGVTGHSFAARLARSPQLGGQVVLAGPPIEESRRLIAGVSLRGAAADFISYALDVPFDALVAQITGGADPAPIARRQLACMAYRSDDGDDFAFTKPGPWQGGRNGYDRPIMIGARNSRTVAGIRELIPDDSVVDVGELPTSFDEARDLATGATPLIVNLTTDSTLLGNPRGSKPKWGIAAAQVPLAVPATGLRDPLLPAITMAPLTRRRGAIDVGYYMPFADPLSPAATWYGIMARPVQLDRVDKASELDAISDIVLAMGTSLGLDPVDPDQTLGRAFVPSTGWRAPGSSAPGTFELRQAAHCGIAAYYADGMTGGAVGGTMAAEAILRGADPYAATAKALARFRRWNWVWWLETARLPLVVDIGLRASVRAAMLHPHTSSRHHWASAA